MITKFIVFDYAGSILDVCDVKLKNNVDVEVAALCIDQQLKLIFSLSWPHTKVYKYNNAKIVMMDLSPWIPSGLSRSRSLSKQCAKNCLR